MLVNVNHTHVIALVFMLEITQNYSFKNIQQSSAQVIFTNICLTRMTFMMYFNPAQTYQEVFKSKLVGIHYCEEIFTTFCTFNDS